MREHLDRQAKLCFFLRGLCNYLNMDLDAVKLVVLVKERPALYNFHMKDYCRKDVINQLWNEIAHEMNCTASDCRLKWHNLRCSYLRYLRRNKHQPSFSDGTKKKKKWYLTDAMSFLNNYVNHNKKVMISDIVKEEDFEAEGEGEGECVMRIEENFEVPDMLNSESLSSTNSFKPFSSDEPWKDSPENICMQSIAVPRMNDTESSLLNFFKGVLPDIEKLNSRRQRVFKEELVKLVNKLADEEEQENSACFKDNATQYVRSEHF